MLKIYQGTPSHGVACLSPACMELETWLRIARIPYESKGFDYAEAPKGKIPYIRTEEGQLMGDSTLIIEYLKQRYGKEPDSGLSTEQRAASVAFRRMLKENDYWTFVIHTRYNDPENWVIYREQIKSQLPSALPAEQKEAIAEGLRKTVRDQMHGQGIGRHTSAEISLIGIQDLTAVSDYLGNKPYFMGDEPTTADAAVYAYVANLIDVPFKSPVRDFGLSRSNLVAYCRRMEARFFPELQSRLAAAQ